MIVLYRWSTNVSNIILLFVVGFIGMALSYGLSLNMSLVMSIQNQCTLVNYIISVERLNQYMHIPSEAPLVIEDNRPPPNWPAVGKVEIHDLQVIPFKRIITMKCCTSTDF